MDYFLFAQSDNSKGKDDNISRVRSIPPSPSESIARDEIIKMNENIDSLRKLKEQVEKKQ